jgi:hypothetical protein
VGRYECVGGAMRHAMWQYAVAAGIHGQHVVVCSRCGAEARDAGFEVRIGGALVVWVVVTCGLTDDAVAWWCARAVGWR